MTDAERRLSQARVSRVPVRLSVELGRADRRLVDAVQMHDGEVLQLDREVGSPVDIYVDGYLYASGQLITVNGDWAVRVQQILNDPPTSTENRRSAPDAE